MHTAHSMRLLRFMVSLILKTFCNQARLQDNHKLIAHQCDKVASMRGQSRLSCVLVSLHYIKSVLQSVAVYLCLKSQCPFSSFLICSTQQETSCISSILTLACIPWFRVSMLEAAYLQGRNSVPHYSECSHVSAIRHDIVF